MRLTIVFYLLLITTKSFATENGIQLKSLFYLDEKEDNRYDKSDIEGVDFNSVADSVFLNRGRNYWLKIEVENNSENDFFELDLNLKAKGYSIFRRYRNSLEPFGAGYYRPLFGKLEIKNGEKWTVYLPSHSKEAFYIYVIDVDAQWLKHNLIKTRKNLESVVFSKDMLFVGFEQAVFLIVIIFALFAFVTYREKIYLLFVFYLVCNAVLFIAVHNIFGIYLFKNMYDLNFALRILHPIGMVSYIVFVNYAVDLKNVFGKAYTFFVGPFILLYILFVVFSIIISFYDFELYSNNIVRISFYFAVVGVFIMLSGFPRYKKFGKLFATGTLVLLLLVCVRIYQINFNHSSYHLPFEIGMMADALIFAYSLNVRTKYLIAENLKIQSEYKKLEFQLKESNQKLMNESFSTLKKDAVYQDFTSQVENLTNSGSVDASRLKNLLKAFYNRNHDESYWQEFDVLFNAVHDGFSTSLYAQYPDLTKSELRLCCLLRVSMSSKEIAKLTNRTEKSVEVMRSRVRKKINIPKGESLTRFLAKYE